MVDPGLIGARHPVLTTLRRLSRRRSARRDEQAFVIEGSTLVGDALDAGIRLRAAVIEAGSEDALAARLRHAGIDVFLVAAGGLDKVVSTVTPQPVAAIGELGRADLAGADLSGAHLVLVLVGLADPGNAGTLLRVAEAADAGAVLCSGATVDPYNPKCVRASAGSLFRIPIVTEEDVVPALERLRTDGFQIVGTSPRAPLVYDEVDLSGRSALVLGSEAHGLSPDVVELLDLTVRIPMAGRAESLNVAAAGAVMAFEVQRQRRRAEGRPSSS